MIDRFPIMKAGHISNNFDKSLLGEVKRVLSEIEIDYPCRLDAMAINPAAVCYNSSMIFTPGEVVVSINEFIKVKAKYLGDDAGKLIISKSTKRKVLVKHSYLLMCSALDVTPSLEISVLENIPKHCGFGSSSSTITAVAAAINEIFNCPISNDDLVKYVASNHGEEVSDSDEDNLKVVQSIGGGATSGLNDEGILIIAGQATKIAKMFYQGRVLICIPKDFKPKDAKVLMELEEDNLWKFKKTGDMYAEKIAYDILHLALPGMVNGDIKHLAKVVFNYRFNMGSNENCSFVYDGLSEIGKKLRTIYENGECEFLALSSVGPAYFAIVKNDWQEERCREKMESLNMDIIKTSICNTKYKVIKTEENLNFWQKESTIKEFQNKSISQYIKNVLDTLDVKGKNCIDIGCGGGRYSLYLKDKGANVLAVDKNKEMIGEENSKVLNFIRATMSDIPVNDNSYELVLSIGVIHNAESLEEYKSALREMYRILVPNGKVILSVFTNELISSDLTYSGDSLYLVYGKPPMILLSKEEIIDNIKLVGFNNIKIIDEHITDVGTGKRNVFTLSFEK